MNDSPELFIDQECTVCSSFGKKALKHSDRLYVKSIANLNCELQSLDSVILKTNTKTYIGMDAIVKVVGGWGGHYKYIKITKMFPKIVNRFIYRLISINRHRLSTILDVKSKG